jgi:hypothetical protein
MFSKLKLKAKFFKDKKVMRKDTIIIVAFFLSFFYFIVTSLIYSQIFLYGDQSITLLFPENSKALMIADDNQSSFWYPQKGNILSDDSNTKIRGLNSLMIKVDIRPTGTLFEHRFKVAQNWSDKNFFSFYWYGQKTEYTFRIHILTPNWDNRAYFDFYDDSKGWKKIFLLLHEPTGIVGSYNLSQVKCIIYALPDTQATGTWYLDEVMVEKETIWLTLLANLEKTIKILIYSSAIALTMSGIMVRKIRENHVALESTKICLRDSIIYTFFGSISGFLIWFILQDIGWLAYIISFMVIIFTVTLSVLSQKEN